MRIIVCGSRTFTDYALLKKKLDHLTKNLKNFEIVSGAADGADKLAEEWCYRNLKKPVLIRFYPDSAKYGDSAGPKRNSEMITYAKEFGKGKAAVVAFWDGLSKGTFDTISKARKLGIRTIVVPF